MSEKPKGNIPEFIQKLTQPSELKNVMANAKEKGRMDVYWAAFERLCIVQGKNHENPMLKDFYAMLSAYESLLSERNGKNTSASRTRQKINRLEEKKCLEDWALSKKATPGFLLLVENNLPQYTAEAVVLKYANEFSNDVVSSAKKRLEDHGVDTNLLK